MSGVQAGSQGATFLEPLAALTPAFPELIFCLRLMCLRLRSGLLPALLFCSEGTRLDEPHTAIGEPFLHPQQWFLLLFSRRLVSNEGIVANLSG